MDNDNKLIISTEHGPKGGDEINIDLLNEEIPKNLAGHFPMENIMGIKKNFAETYEEAPFIKVTKTTVLLNL